MMMMYIALEVLLDWKARYGTVFTVWLPNPMVVVGDHKVSLFFLYRPRAAN